MQEDLLKNTQKQVVELIEHGFYKEAEAICVQAEKVFENKSLKQLRTVATIGLKDWITAESLINELIKTNPSASDFNNLSIVKKNQNLLHEAKKYAHMAVKLNFTNPLYLANFSCICWLLGEKKEAFEFIDKAIELQESDVFWQNKASFFADEKQYKQAIDCYKNAIKINDKSDYYVEIFYILAKQKRYIDAWIFYEHRYVSMPQVSQIVQRIKTPILPLDANANSKIAIFYEQGLGDCLMYLRFIPLFKEKYPNSYILDTDDSMKNITKEICIQKEQAISADTDFMLGMMSLPYHLGIKEIPPSFPNFIHKPCVTKYKKVGIVWAGGPYHPSDELRSAYLRDFEPILHQEDWQIFSLMKDKRKRKRVDSDEIIDYAEGFEEYKIIDLGPEITDLKSTIELLDQIDILISVDTAIVHIAGLKNVPTFLLISENCDWRWGVDDKFSDWYPNLQIFRKTKNETYKDLCVRLVKEIRGE